MINKYVLKTARDFKPSAVTTSTAGFWGTLKLSVLAASLVTFTGCATTFQPSGKTKTVTEDTKDFPYNPAAFHLDLSILSYQLYAQTLVWPFDPYYEDQNDLKWNRAKMLNKVRAWTVEKGAAQTSQKQSLADYRGPGVLSGFSNDASHDPIIYRYNQLNPWSSTITRAEGKWKESRTPREVTDPIRDVYMCFRPKPESANQVSIKRIQPQGFSPKADARDVILAFEGETGDKGESGQAGSQSFLGYALVRHWPGSEKFDVHVVFRGSRSGAASRALLQALSTTKAKGNPDWITDLGYNLIGTGDIRNRVTTTGRVFRGFAHSIAASTPKIFGCLDYINKIRPGKSPERIFVTGHSLGGGLAQHFTSTVLMGNRYGVNAANNKMSASLQRWPWKNIKLVSFAAPRAGDAVWAKTLTETHLKSSFFTSRLNPFDSKALTINDPSITKNLLRTDMPSGYRVLISRDPITTGKGIVGKHVGKTVYLDKTSALDALKRPDPSAHEPLIIRELLVDGLSDPRVPDWSKKQARSIPAKLAKKDVGSEAGYLKLKAGYEAYLKMNSIPYNKQAFDNDFKSFLSILRSK